MKHNAEKALNLIQQALKALGDDFALSSARSYLGAALREVQKVQNKRQKREDNYKKEMKQLELSREEANKRMNKLDQMFDEEKSKLQIELDSFGSP